MTDTVHDDERKYRQWVYEGKGTIVEGRRLERERECLSAGKHFNGTYFDFRFSVQMRYIVSQRKYDARVMATRGEKNGVSCASHLSCD